MRSALIAVLVLLCANLAAIYFIYNLIPMTFTSTEPDSEYSLVIDEGDELKAQWQYRTINQSIFEKLLNETDINFDMTSYMQDEIVEWDFSVLEDRDSCCRTYYWDVLRDEYKKIGDIKHYISSYKYKIYKTPDLYLKSMFSDDNYYTNRLIPIEVDDFIMSLNYYIYHDNAWLLEYSKNYTLETNSINTITKLLRNNTNYEETFVYNEEGILYHHTIYYENQTAMEMMLIKYEIDKLDPQPPTTYRWFLITQLINLLLISTIIEIIIVIVLISMVDDSHNNKTLDPKINCNKNTNPQINSNKQFITSSGQKPQNPIIKHQLCSNCLAVLEKDSKFCYNCGKKIKNEAYICQYCGKLKLKGARYCIECGHML
ncbi:MAG: zinc ribbon domain-containing protein [Promethearchaeota archaeon]